jgi:uncharacterized protein YoxC
MILLQIANTERLIDEALKVSDNPSNNLLIALLIVAVASLFTFCVYLVRSKIKMAQDYVESMRETQSTMDKVIDMIERNDLALKDDFKNGVARIIDSIKEARHELSKNIERLERHT